MNKRIQVAILGVFVLAVLQFDSAWSQDGSARSLHMHEQLVRLTDVKASLLIGELGAAREPATWLAEHAPADIPPMYESFIDAMQSHAVDVVESQNVEDAAKGMATIATDCASCHSAMRVNLEFGFDEPPPQWTDMQSHMQRHQWAMDRLWEGLIGPSDAAWARGIRMLAEAPLKGTENTWGEEEDHGGDALARQVHELGMVAATALTPEARSTVYGEIIGTCAACHTRTGGGPRPD